jgi:hypothetical protein
MNLRTVTQLAVALAAFAAVSPAVAQNYDTRIYNVSVGAEPIEQATPSFPSGLRIGQEGWVSINYVITADGQAIDPVILDSVGGIGFEQSAREALLEIHDGRDKATPNFMRRYRSILQHLHYEENADARKSVISTLERGGWNLYESTMLWLMVGRVAGAEGDNAAKLEHYRRALGVSNRNSLDDEDLRDLLAKMFTLEMELSQYAAAKRTLDRLMLQPGAAESVAGLRELMAKLDAELASDSPIAAEATLFRPCQTEDGEPIWAYSPVRQSFSFARLNGNVERFEVRCERNRLEGPVKSGKTWSLPEAAQKCQVIVFGDDGASFQFVEHNETESSEATAEAAVARSDVLD